jgi:hypothetical protein
VERTQNANRTTYDVVRNDVGKSRYNQLPRPFNTPGSAKGRILCQYCNLPDYFKDDADGGARIIPGYKIVNGLEISSSGGSPP